MWTNSTPVTPEPMPTRASATMTIPPVYFVAAASPNPSPAITKSRRRPRRATPALPHSERQTGASVGESFRASLP